MDAPLLQHRQCDWRVHHDPACPDFDFFRTAFIVFISITAVVVVLLFYSLCFRHFALRDKLSSFFHGLNASLIYLFISQVFFLIHLALVLSGSSPVAAEVVWFLGLSSVLAPMVNHLNLIITAIPDLKYDTFKMPAVVLNPHIRGFLLMGYVLLILALNCVLTPLADSYLLAGNVELSNSLFTAGMAVATANMLVLAMLFSFFFYHFKKASAERMDVIRSSEVRANKKEFQLLALTVDKVNRAFYSMILLVPFTALFTVLMASYRDFYVNFPLSKAFLILFYVLFEGSGLMLSLTFIRVDYAKYVTKGDSSDDYQKNNSAHGHVSPKVSKEDPLDVALDDFKNNNRVSLA